MYVVNGRVEHWVDRWWLLERLAAVSAAEVAIDLGTGDGAYVVRRARLEPRRLWIGVDANAENLAETSRRAARKPEKGGVANALFVRATAEALPDELAGLAAHVSILMPWGSLLRAVMEADPEILAGVRALCRPGATVEVVAGEALDPAIVAGWADAGFDVALAPVPLAEVRRLGTTWASRLAFGKERAFWRLAGRAR